MKKYTSEDIQKALHEVGIKRGDIVNIHSCFIALGRLVGTEVSNPVENTISVILNYLGENGTLVAPVFNFDFCEGEIFNRQETPSKNMGVISEAIRNWNGALRSSHPAQSVSAIGKMATFICEPDTLSAFSIGGSFHRMLELNSKLLFYGVSFESASFVHYIEERLKVPYRFWKRFRGEYIDGNISESREYRMYVRDLDLHAQLHLGVFQQKMISDGKLKSAKLGMTQIYSCTYFDFFVMANEMMKQDPFCVLSNKKEVIEKLRKRTQI